MKKQKYIVKIDNPCKEDWTSMSKSDIGKFCNRCAKTVIDFTTLDDDEIISIIEQSNEKICGRFNTTQLNRYLCNEAIYNQSKRSNILASLLLVSITGNSFATNELPQLKEITSFNETYTKSEHPQIIQHSSKDSLEKHIIQGKIIDSTSNEPVTYAWILIKGSKIGIASELNGDFKLEIPDSLMREKIDLVISCVGYDKTEITIYTKDSPFNIYVHPIKHELLGEMIIVRKKKWWQRIKL